MGKKSSPSPPAAPDPTALANAQGAANKEAVLESAKVNQINQVTPFGSLTYTGDVGSPDRTATQTLAPEDQARLDQQRALYGQLSDFASTLVPQITDKLGSPLDFSGLPSLDIGTAGRDAATNAAYGRLTNLLAPQIEQGRKQQETSLINRGLPIGSEAYGKASDRFERQANDALLQAGNQAVLTGDQELAAEFGRALQGRQQGISELLTGRSQPINELSALTQGGPAIGLPTFTNTNAGSIAPADVIGANALSQNIGLAGFNAANQQQAAQTGGMYGLAGSVASALPFFFL